MKFRLVQIYSVIIFFFLLILLFAAVESSRQTKSAIQNKGNNVTKLVPRLMIRLSVIRQAHQRGTELQHGSQLQHGSRAAN